MKVLAELTVIPIGVGTSFSKYIAECERLFKTTNVKFQLHAEGTNLEGEMDEVLNLVKQCHELVHDMNVPRIVTTLKISTRLDKKQTMKDRVESVEQKIKQNN